LTSQQKTSLYSRSKANHRLTVGYTYFEEPDRLRNLLDIWKTWPANLDIFLVDDGSTAFPALEVIQDFHLEDWQPTFQLWKCTRNLGFNSHGCRNLIAKYAHTDVIQFMDIDMHMHAPELARLKKMVWEKDYIAHHICYRTYDQKVVAEPGHLNAFAIHKELYWKAGGYDESFTGHHWGDREFLDRIHALPHQKIKTGCSLVLDRKGKHGVVTNTVDKTEYAPGDERRFKAPMGPEDIKKLKGTVKTRLNFPFIKLKDL